MNVFAAIKEWLEAPFKVPLNIVDIFLIVGVIIIATLLWHRVLKWLPRATEVLE